MEIAKSMIKPGAKLHAQRIPIVCLQVKLHRQRYGERLMDYVVAMTQHPECDILLNVAPSDTHPGMYCILDGHHRFLASIVIGRKDCLCIVIEENA